MVRRLTNIMTWKLERFLYLEKLYSMRTIFLMYNKNMNLIFLSPCLSLMRMTASFSIVSSKPLKQQMILHHLNFQRTSHATISKFNTSAYSSHPRCSHSHKKVYKESQNSITCSRLCVVSNTNYLVQPSCFATRTHGLHINNGRIPRACFLLTTSQAP